MEWETLASLRKPRHQEIQKKNSNFYSKTHHIANKLAPLNLTK